LQKGGFRKDKENLPVPFTKKRKNLSPCFLKEAWKVIDVRG